MKRRVAFIIHGRKVQIQRRQKPERLHLPLIKPNGHLLLVGRVEIRSHFEGVLDLEVQAFLIFEVRQRVDRIVLDRRVDH